MQTDWSNKQLSKAFGPMDEREESTSNDKSDRRWHRAKHSGSRVSTDVGMLMDESDKHPENADSPMDSSRESGSNATSERSTHSEKQRKPSSSSIDGIQTQRRAVQSAKASDFTDTSFEPNSKIT
jgi:hypothetical protein